MAGDLDSLDSDSEISGINVTPLVDVVLVLLIVFMIAAPTIYQSAIKVQLPKAKSGEQATGAAFSFTVKKDGTLIWNKETLSWEALNERLAKLHPSPDQSASISADTEVAHGTVIRLMDALRMVGITRFALSVESAAPPSSR